MTMFGLVTFERDRHITLLSRRFRWVFGDVAITYMVLPAADGCRVVVKLLGRYARGSVAWLLQPAMPWLDLLMMRRQLYRLRDLAERDAHSPDHRR